MYFGDICHRIVLRYFIIATISRPKNNIQINFKDLSGQDSKSTSKTLEGVINTWHYQFMNRKGGNTLKISRLRLETDQLHKQQMAQQRVNSRMKAKRLHNPTN
jgi:hypothetical protein